MCVCVSNLHIRVWPYRPSAWYIYIKHKEVCGLQCPKESFIFFLQLRKKQNIVEQAGQLKRFIVSLQLAADKREQSEKNLRYKLEKEVEALRLGSKQVRYRGAYSCDSYSCVKFTGFNLLISIRSIADF